MFTPEAFFPVLERLFAILDRCTIRYQISGGLASVYYSEPRLTQDIDLVVDPKQLNAHLEEFLQSVTDAEYLSNPQAIREAVPRGRMFQLIDTKECLKVDLYPRELVEGSLDRSVWVELTPGWQVPITSRPDAVISKLVWISKGSHKCRRDLRQIFRRMPDSERDLTYHFADHLSLRPMMEEVLAEPNEIDV